MRVFFRYPCRTAPGAVGPVRPSFRDPRFGCFLAGEAVNSIGGWASAIVVWGFAAYRFNAGPYAVSVTIVCWAAPPAVLSPLTGVYVDRLGPKTALVAGYVGAGCAALSMAAAGTLLQLDVAAAAYGIARALAGPAASALPARIVAADDLLAANSLLGAAASTGQVAGPVAASAALALSGFEAAFVLDAASYLVGAVAVAPLTARPADGAARPADGAARPGWRRDFAEGITLMARHGGLRLVTAMTAAVSLTSGAFLVVEPLYARHLLHRPPSQFALFEAAAGTGAVVAGLAVPRFRDRLTGRSALAGSAVGYGLAAAVFIGTRSVPVAYLGAFTWGVSGAVFMALSVTTLQKLAPMHTHGRIMGVITTVESALSTIGLPVAGVTLAVLGIRPGALSLAAVAVTTGMICLLIAITAPRTT